MAKAKNQSGRNWTSDELQEFVLVLLDKEKCFATSLKNYTDLCVIASWHSGVVGTVSD